MSFEEQNTALKKFFLYLSAFGSGLNIAVQNNFFIGDLNSLSIAGLKSGLQLNDDLVKVLCAGIVDCGVRLHSLSLKCHLITDTGAAEIGKLVSNPNVGLKELDLEGNDISTPSLLSVGSDNLFSLDLSSNPLGEKGGMELASFLQSNLRLKYLGVNCCDLNLVASIGLITALHDNTNLQVLKMDKPLLNYSKQEETTDHISRVLLNKSSALQQLSMRYHAFGDRGSRMLSDALSRNEILTHINLESNKICDAGAESLASFLILQHRQRLANPHLSRNFVESIKLSHNFISDEGAISIAEAIRCNTFLREVDLRSNVIGKEGLCAIAEALQVNKTLRSLTLFGNNFEQTSGKMFYDLDRKSVV